MIGVCHHQLGVLCRSLFQSLASLHAVKKGSETRVRVCVACKSPKEDPSNSPGTSPDPEPAFDLLRTRTLRVPTSTALWSTELQSLRVTSRGLWFPAVEQRNLPAQSNVSSVSASHRA